jgi:hypothetical protein
VPAGFGVSFDAGMNGVVGPSNPYMTYAGTQPYLADPSAAMATTDPFRQAAVRTPQAAAAAPPRAQAVQRTPKTAAAKKSTRSTASSRKRSAAAMSKRAN